MIDVAACEEKKAIRLRNILNLECCTTWLNMLSYDSEHMIVSEPQSLSPSIYLNSRGWKEICFSLFFTG